MKSSTSEANHPLRSWSLAFASAGLYGLSAHAAEESVPRVQNATMGSTILSGYVDTSVMWSATAPKDAGAVAAFPNTLRTPGRLHDTAARMNGFNLNVVSLELDRPLSNESWSVGYHLQMLFGPDALLRNSYSLASGSTEQVGLTGAYVVARAPLGNGLELRMGYFSSPLGYEVYDSYRNPNYSRSYGYFIEPKAHTGLTAKYDFTDWCSVMGGVANSYSAFFDAPLTHRRASKTYLGLVTFNAGAFWRRDATLTLGYTGGNTATSAATDTFPRIHSFYAGARIPLGVAGLSLGLSYDYQANFAAGVPALFVFPAGPMSSYANAAAMYLNYDVAKWQLRARGEYATATAGNTILASRGAFGSSRPMFGPHDDKFVGVTGTVGYRFWENVVTRFETRWDRDVAGGVPVLGTAAHPLRNSVTVGVNLIYRF